MLHVELPRCSLKQADLKQAQFHCHVFPQVLSLKGIQCTITDRDFDAIAGLEELQEIVLDCDQPPEGQGQTDEAKWGLLHFPEAMKQLTNMTHLTLSCHYGITALPQGISRLNKLEVSPPACT